MPRESANDCVRLGYITRKLHKCVSIVIGDCCVKSGLLGANAIIEENRDDYLKRFTDIENVVNDETRENFRQWRTLLVLQGWHLL